MYDDNNATRPTPENPDGALAVADKPREDWFCDNCGKRTIIHDALVKWDPETQQFEVIDVLDDMTCSECDDDYIGATYRESTCAHEDHEDCMICTECNECHETLDDDDVCDDCRESDTSDELEANAGVDADPGL